MAAVPGSDPRHSRRPTLLQAVFMGRNGDVRSLLEQAQPGDVDVVDEQSKRSALHLAAQTGDVVSTQLLLERGINVNAFDKSGWAAVHHAANSGTNGVLLELLKHGVDVNLATKNSNQLSPLHLAVTEGRESTVKLLIEHGADVAFPDRQKRSPLYKAVRWGHPNIVGMLIAHGALATAELSSCLDLCPKERPIKALISRYLSEGLTPEEEQTFKRPLDEAAILREAQAQFEANVRQRQDPREPSRLSYPGEPAVGADSRPSSTASARPVSMPLSPSTLAVPAAHAEPVTPPSTTALRSAQADNVLSPAAQEDSKGGCCVVL